MTSLPILFAVDAALSGERLDRALAATLPGMSRTRAQALIEGERVRVNGRPAKAGLRLENGMQIEVLPPAPEEITSRVSPGDLAGDGSRLPMSLPIVYEDADLLVVEKPAGLVVHSAPGHETGTLVDELRAHLDGPWTQEESLRPGIVHRLDKDTSGLLVVAKNPEAHAELAGQMKAHSTIKRYLALVEGRMTVPEGVVDAPIGRDPRHRQRMAIVRAGGSGGREARTRFRTLQAAQGRTLLEVQLETGRTHQIRVHLAAIHHPIVGDLTYGRPEPPQPPRQFLHATHLEFAHPRTGQWLIFDSPLPPDLADFARPWLPDSAE
jgi:23S rRNA pseudouridine1911/1915/1917 synthase